MDIFGTGTFVGEFRHSVDAKGRLTIPSKWRIDASGDQDTFLALPGSGGLISVYPPEMIARLKEKAASMSMGDTRGQRALAAVMSMAHSFSADKQGRINLNGKLLRHASIDKEAVLLGMMSRFDIYSPDSYERLQGGIRDGDVERMTDALAELGF